MTVNRATVYRDAASRGTISSSIMATNCDIESQLRPTLNSVSHIIQLFDQAGVTKSVLEYHHYPGNGTAESPYLVDFLPIDCYNPVTFSPARKWLNTLTQATATLAVTFASSSYTGGILEITQDFNVSEEVATLGVSMFVVGFAIGPLFWAPLSELYGRQKIFFVSYMALTAFNAGAAGAPTMGALIVLRFLAGSFGSAPLTNAGGVIADMFSATERGIANSLFAMAPFLGPALGPIAGGFLGETAGWRWIEGLISIFCGVVWILSSVTYVETYSPVLLRKRAAKLSKQTGLVYISKLDEHQPPVSIRIKFRKFLSRPWILLFKEPIVLLTSTYMAIIYGTLYLCFSAFPIVFQQGHGWSPGIGGLAFIGIAVGMIIATLGSIIDNKRYARIAAASPGGVAPPEARLLPAIIGSILLPVGLFWFAWTNETSIHWIVPIIGSAIFAAGILSVFVSLMNYLIDSYVIFAASVLAANSILRSLFGAAFPLFSIFMFRNLGNHWASSVPAFLALGCLPFPFLFYKYGERVRARCKFAAEAARVLERIRGKSKPVTETGVVAETSEVERDK